MSNDLQSPAVIFFIHKPCHLLRGVKTSEEGCSVHSLQSNICSSVLCSFGLPCNVMGLFTFRYGVEEKLKVGCCFERVAWHEVTRKKAAVSR